MTQPASVPPATSRESYERAVQEVVRGALAFVNARWGEAQFTDAAMVAFVDDVVPVVLAAQQQVAALTSVHLAHLTGIDPLPVPANLYERGVAPEVVYQRPIVAARRALAEGKSVAQARLAGERRLESLVRTDIQMAKVRQADRVMRAAGVRFYKRVPKGAATCALCLIASTQRYKVGKLLPIHPGCDCGVEPLPGDKDPGHVIDEDLLEATHARVAAIMGEADRGGRNPDYRKLIVTHEHGEIGPLVAWKGDRFTGRSQIPDEYWSPLPSV